MRFDLHLRTTVREQVAQVAEAMSSWEAEPRITDEVQTRIRQELQIFEHTPVRERLLIGGAESSGDFPALSYADSHIYVTVAQGMVYAADRVSGLREVGPTSEPIVHLTWLPEDKAMHRRTLDATLETLAGRQIEEVVSCSDYQRLKRRGSKQSPSDMADSLIRPQAADAANIGIQLRATAELGAVLRLLHQHETMSYVLIGGTLSLPLIDRADLSLFFEHLKRLCCVEARARAIGFFALSRSHGLPGIELIEELARARANTGRGSVAEHWYLRVPVADVDEWELPLANGRSLPPAGAVTYLLRFHRTTPVLRLDMDIAYWQERVRGRDDEETRANERRIFEDLDYASHDQRCYGSPYPLRASHDRVTLSQAERTALRKQIVDAAVRAGMKRSLFRDAARAAGEG